MITIFSQANVLENINNSILLNNNKMEFNKSSVHNEPKENFADYIKDALVKVNDLQLNSDQAVQKMIVDPSSIDLHEVTVALTKAELSLFLAKSVTERVIRAYNDIVNLR